MISYDQMLARVAECNRFDAECARRATQRALADLYDSTLVECYDTIRSGIGSTPGRRRAALIALAGLLVPADISADTDETLLAALTPDLTPDQRQVFADVRELTENITTLADDPGVAHYYVHDPDTADRGLSPAVLAPALIEDFTAERDDYLDQLVPSC